MYQIWSDPFGAWQWVIANSAIALAYFVIGTRHLLRHGGIGWLYGAFILSCGLGHALMVAFMGFWHTRPLWMVVIGIDSLTAMVSLAAAMKVRANG